MSERVTLDRTPDGRLVAVKRSAVDGDERLRREAIVLERARHPGVVELVGLLDGDELELHTLAAGGGSLRARAPLPVPRVAALATTLATTLTDLHAVGVVHGRIDADHVLVGADGRPLLCGFAEARLPEDADGPAPPDDVAGLGRLVFDLLEVDTAAEPIPDLRRWLPRPRRGWTGYQERALLTLADQASADEPAHRPTARALAAALSAAFPDATLADEDDTDQQRRPGHLLERHRAVLLGAAAVLAGTVGLTTLAVGASALRGERPAVQADTAAPATAGTSDPPTSSGATATTSTTEAQASTSTTADGRDEPGDTTCPDGAGPVADLDGDGCAGDLEVDGRIVSTEAGRFEVGEPDDVVVVGDWDCDGSATAAVLRPSTGDVFVFDRWATGEGEAATPATAAVDGASGLQVDLGPTCDVLLATGDGPPTPVEVEAAP